MFMKAILGVAGVALLVALPLARAAEAQDTKDARGVVTATAPDALTVKVGSSEMTFKIDKSTRVATRGGSTAMREAREKGQEHLPYTNFVKVGQTVVVSYHAAGMHAASIRVVDQAAGGTKASAPPPPSPAAGAAAAPAAPRAKSGTATGTVTAVSATSLTIKTSSGEETFNVDGKTKVLGQGLGTQAREMKSAGEKQMFDAFVHKGDMVRVLYEDTAGAKHASEVRVTRKAAS
jgi:hypothetical protein